MRKQNKTKKEYHEESRKKYNKKIHEIDATPVITNKKQKHTFK